MKKRMILGMLALSAVFAVGLSAEVYAASGNDLIEENIYVGGIDVGGLDVREAEAKVSEYVDGLKEETFTFDYNDNSVTVSAADMGLTWVDDAKLQEVCDIGKTGNLIDRYKIKKDLEHENINVDITLEVDRDKIKNIISEKLSVYDVAPKNYGLIRENGGFTITEGNTGVAVDVDASTDEVVSYMEKDWDRESGAALDMVTVVTEPESKKEDLEKVQDVLGTFTTDFSTSSWGRAQNVKNGASKINGTLLYPGEELSVYDLVNPMTAENGYELAGSYENGTTVQTYGGGICQVSSTLYNAAIRAEMRIEERYCHSMIVSYVQPSMDAAMAGTYKNLRFTNPYHYPVYIEGYTNSGMITFTIYGCEERPSNRVVTYESETLSTMTPELVVQTTQDPIGYVATVQGAHEGKTACLWKVVTVDGVEESREVYNRSTYNASSKIIAVGVASDNPDAVAAINAAIATKNEDTIRSTAASYAAPAEGEEAEGEEAKEEEAGDDSSQEVSESDDTSASESTSDNSDDADDADDEPEAPAAEDTADNSSDDIEVDPDVFEEEE